MSWGPAVDGAKRIYAPDWRYLHSGELAIMMLIPAMILNFYFDNGPKKYTASVNIALRLIIILLSMGVFHFLYYKFSPALLGTQAGYSHPQQFPMAPGILFICCMLFHNWFMDFWPGKKRIGIAETMLDEDGEVIGADGNAEAANTPDGVPAGAVCMETKEETISTNSVRDVHSEASPV